MLLAKQSERRFQYSNGQAQATKLCLEIRIFDQHSEQEPEANLNQCCASNQLCIYCLCPASGYNKLARWLWWLRRGWPNEQLPPSLLLIWHEQWTPPSPKRRRQRDKRANESSIIITLDHIDSFSNTCALINMTIRQLSMLPLKVASIYPDRPTKCLTKETQLVFCLFLKLQLAIPSVQSRSD